MNRLLVLFAGVCTVIWLAAGATAAYAQHDDPDMEWEDITEEELLDIASTQTAIPLFQRLGGQSQIDSLVNEFVSTVMKDEKLKDHFKKTDQTKWKEQLKGQLIKATGGEIEYTGKGFKESLSEMGLKEEDFQKIAQHLAGILDKHNVSAADKEALLAVLEIKSETH